MKVPEREELQLTRNTHYLKDEQVRVPETAAKKLDGAMKKLSGVRHGKSGNSQV